MKHINVKSGLIMISLAFSLFFTGCTEKINYMESDIIDMNSRITDIDKEVTQPGDVVTITGTDLDKVYKVMLNAKTDPVVQFTATATSLQLTIPATSPLGDVVSIQLLFSGKGLATVPIRIISPPVIYALTPEAIHIADVVTVLGKELHLAQTVRIAGVDVTSSLVVNSDKEISVVVPDGFTGGNLTIESATGSISTSPYPLILGTELMINNFDGNNHYNAASFISSNGNLDNDTEETGAFPRNKYYTFTIKDNNTGWGGNVDFNTTGMPATYTDLTKVSLSVDIYLTKAMSVNVMIARGSDVWGKTISLALGWNSVVLPFSDMGSGYGSTPSSDPAFMPLPLFSAISGVKIQPPCQTANGNFGEKISIDNIKFIIVD